MRTDPEWSVYLRTWSCGCWYIGSTNQELTARIRSTRYNPRVLRHVEQLGGSEKLWVLDQDWGYEQGQDCDSVWKRIERIRIEEALAGKRIATQEGELVPYLRLDRCLSVHWTNGAYLNNTCPITEMAPQQSVLAGSDFRVRTDDGWHQVSEDNHAYVVARDQAEQALKEALMMDVFARERWTRVMRCAHKLTVAELKLAKALGVDGAND